MVYEALWANQYYTSVEAAYTTGKKYDDTKVAIAKCYSRAANNVVDMWYSIWIRAGGRANPKIDGKPKYYPPYNSKHPAMSLPQHRMMVEDEQGAEQPSGQ